MTTLDAQTRSGAGPALSRFVGSWPKIGIRPAIDGRRRGVRESLEDQTMAMANATAMARCSAWEAILSRSGLMAGTPCSRHEHEGIQNGKTNSP